MGPIRKMATERGIRVRRKNGGSMMEVPLGLANMSATGLLIVETAFIVLALVKGWIVVKVHYDAAVQTAENYRQVSEKKTETIHIQAQTIHDYGVVGETVVKVMGSLQETASREAGEK